MGPVKTAAEFVERYENLKRKLDKLNLLSPEDVLMFKMSIDQLRSDGTDYHKDILRFFQTHSDLVSLEMSLLSKVRTQAGHTEDAE